MSLKNIMSEETPLPKIPSQNSILLSDYISKAKTDELPEEEGLDFVLMGLFGEVGSVMATSKKLCREKDAYIGYKDALDEELGDTLWYFTILCNRLGYGIDQIFLNIVSGESYEEILSASDLTDGPISRISTPRNHLSLEKHLLALGQAAAELLTVKKPNEKTLHLLRKFADRYLKTVRSTEIAFAKIVDTNIKKVRGRFLRPVYKKLDTFDSKFPEEERLPQSFRIKIKLREKGRSYMEWKGVFIGDPLTDNILNEDGYRFHDVFHLSYAAILHWSPIFRSLIKRKRKSDKKIDEAEDGGRAIVVEEGLSAWIFSYAKDLNFFEDQKKLSFDLLKTVQKFVKGYEVERCPLYMWERAILDGYAVFREVLKNNGGIVVGNRNKRTITYEPLPESE